MENVDNLSTEPNDNPSMRCRVPRWPLRVYAGIMTISGTIFVPLSWYPILMPGLLIWIGWLTIAFGKPKFNTPLFWSFSMIFNCLIGSFLLWLRNGHFGPFELSLAFVWSHLAFAIIGSAIVFFQTAVSIDTNSNSQTNKVH